jgi:glycerate kinase
MRRAAPVVLVATDKFRGSLRADEAARAMAVGVLRAVPGARVEILPVADGGEGTVELALAAGFEPETVRVRGPLGGVVRARWARRGEEGVVEAASAVGRGALGAEPLAPLRASSEGVGDLVRCAASAGVRRLVVGLGDSVTIDGGSGMLRALGAGILDGDGREVPAGGGFLAAVRAVHLEAAGAVVRGLDLVAACDVDVGLLGASGAARLFGPQKGANPTEVARLEEGLRGFADVLEAASGRRARALPGAGAAGGLGFGLAAGLGAPLAPGGELLGELIHLHERVARADLVVTGEGALDAQSLRGKAPLAVAHAAQRAGVPCVAVVGRLELPPDVLAEQGVLDAAAIVESQVATRGADQAVAELAGRLARRWLGAAP